MHSPVPSQARVVVIGGGVIGCSVAYHLAKRGWSDVVVLERLQLTHGSTWHAAGLVGQLRSSSNLTRLMRYGAQLYGSLEQETGQATGWRGVGSLRLAASADRWSELKRAATMGKGFGLEVELISPNQARDLFPLIETDGLLGAAWIASDGYVDPSMLTNAYAAGARALGVKILQNVPVTRLLKSARRVSGVVTEHGTILADCVVNAAGMWGGDIAAMTGTRVPVCAVEHQYLVTEKTNRIPADLPTLRDPDARFYVKPEPGALCVGGWEDRTVPFGDHGIAKNFGPELLQPDFDRFAQYGVDAAKRIPYLDEVGVRTMVNGPIPITADGEPIIGLSPDLDNFYLCCGFTSGIAASGGAGSVMANWVIDGDPGMDLWPFDVRRFGQPHVVKQYMYERAIDSYAHYYAIAYPHLEIAAGRNARRSPLHRVLQDKGAVFGNKFAWERPNWFAPPGMPARDTPSYGRAPEFAIIGEEHRAVREAVALIDMSSFSKFELRGPGALALLQELAGNDMDKPVGAITYTQLLNTRGGIEADVTVTRLTDESFYFVTGSALGVRDRSVLERHFPSDGSVQLIDHTSARAVINICGPRSREVLSRVCDAPLDNAHFPYMTAQELDLGFAPVRALRMTYVGELGWELHVPTEYALCLYERLSSVGADLGIRDVGYRAISSLRLEKHYLAWGSDITPDYTPYEAGLGFCVAPAKSTNCLAHEALERLKMQGPARRLCWFTAPAELQLFGGEVVLLSGRVLGTVRSAGYGYTVGSNILCAYLPIEDAIHTDYDIEAMGERYAIVRHTRPLHDPDRKRITA